MPRICYSYLPSIIKTVIGPAHSNGPFRLLGGQCLFIVVFEIATLKEIFLQHFSPSHLSASTLHSVPARIMTCQCHRSSAISVVIWFLAISSLTRSRHHLSATLNTQKVVFPSHFRKMFSSDLVMSLCGVVKDNCTSIHFNYTVTLSESSFACVCFQVESVLQ